MDEMTGPGEDSHKHKSEDAAKYLAESFFGLNMNPADVGGEVLFDDYDDNKSAIQTGSTNPQMSADRAESVQAFSATDVGSSSVTSAPNRFEENLDDLIVFSDDDDDDDVVVDDEDEEEDDENFDFGDEDDEDEEDEEDDEEDFDDDDEDDEEEEEDELDDAELDFGDDVIVPAPKKAVPAARVSGPARNERGVDSRSNPARSGRASGESREEQRPSSSHRSDRRDDLPAARDDRPAARDERSAPRDDRPAPRGGRPQESRSTRADSRGPDRPPAAKAVDAGRKSPSADDEHWNELEGWVWDDEAKKKPAAASASRPIAVDIDDDDDDEEDEIVEAAPAAPAARAESEDVAPRRRGRRRGGRGRGRGRRDEIETAAPAGDTGDNTGHTVDFDDDFSEIMFEEDQEDFVSVSAGSVKAQRRIQDEPPSPAARKSEPDDIDDEEDEDVEGSAEGESGPDRPRRGRRGRGRGRADAREPVRAEERPAASARRPARDEDNMDDDDDDLAVDDVDLTDFGDLDDDDVLPRRREGTRSEPARAEPARSERPPRSGQGRGRSQEEREPREPESTERPRRQPARDSRPAREPQPARDSQPAREARPARDSQQEREPRPAREPRPEREARPSREPRPASAGDEVETRRGPRPPLVAAEFQDIPTWEEAIGSLALRTPSEEHARRAESRGRRDGGGRPPRRKN